jgi:4-hydroxy-2-oxoheptanedioate aldolase
MAETPRLNGAIRALEQGNAAFSTFSPLETGTAQALNAARYDAVVFEMEHNPYDVRALRDCMQYMLDRRQIWSAGSLAPAVTPIARVPANGGEMNQFLAKQVLDMGVYGVLWPHVSTVEEARNAVTACRYPRPASVPLFEPAGQRGDGPKHAVPYWGVTYQEYYARADVWPLNPHGEILVGIMCEETRAIKNLPQMLEQVPGIGYVLIGEGDLSQELGVARQYDHPAVLSAVDDILAICKQYNVVCGHPHANSKNVEELLERGFRWLMTAPSYSDAGLDNGLKASDRL